ASLYLLRTLTHTHNATSRVGDCGQVLDILFLRSGFLTSTVSSARRGHRFQGPPSLTRRHRSIGGLSRMGEHRGGTSPWSAQLKRGTVGAERREGRHAKAGGWRVHDAGWGDAGAGRPGRGPRGWLPARRLVGALFRRDVRGDHDRLDDAGGRLRAGAKDV